MSLRRRLALLSALAVAFAVLLASVLVYTLVRDRLRSDIDNDLRHQADVVTERAGDVAPLIAGSAQGPVTVGTGQGPASLSKNGKPPPPPPGVRKAKGKKAIAAPPEGGDRVSRRRAVPAPGPGGPPSLAQLIGPDGKPVTDIGSQVRLPVSDDDEALATNGGDASFSDVSAPGPPFAGFIPRSPVGGPTP